MARTQTPARTDAGPPAKSAGVKTKPGSLREILRQRLDQITESIPRHLTPERMVHVASTLVYRTPKLQECDATSIVAAVIQASTLGLDLNPTTGEAYLVPVWNKDIGGLECQFRPGYRGLTKLIRQSGAVKHVVAELVYGRDLFFYRRTPTLEFDHTPYLGPEDRGEVTHVYALAKLPDGDYDVEVMTRADVEKIHCRSESYLAAVRKKEHEKGPWVSDWNEMARKTVIRRISKRFDMSPELATAVEAMDRDYDLDATVATTARVHRRGVAGLAERLQLDEPTLPPQSSRVYQEADDFEPIDDDDRPGVDEDRDFDEAEAGSRG